MVGDQRGIRHGAHDDLEPEAFEVGEDERALAALGLDALGSQARLPEVDRLLRGDAPDDAMDAAGAGTTGNRVRVLEEREVGAGSAALLAVEQVVDVRVVLVDGLRDHA